MEGYKKILVGFLLVVLLLPGLNQYFNFAKSAGLRGYFTNAGDTSFTPALWFSGVYQSTKNNFFNDHMGFRPDFARINGQIDFSLFHKVNYGGAEVSDDGNVYYYNYIDEYNGLDYMGRDSIVHTIFRLKRIQDTLAKLGKHLILVYAPSKPYYYKEHLWRRNKCIKPGITNYQTSRQIADSIGLNQADINGWFSGMIGKTRDSVFSKQGIHWTIYGSLLGGDSILRCLERVGCRPLAHPGWTSCERTNEPRETDNDIATVLNLISPLANETFTYPKVTYMTTAATARPRAIFIGDSFNWTLTTNELLNNVFSDWELWYYFKEVFNKAGQKERYRKMDEYNWKQALSRTDVVVVLYTTANLPKLGGGFIEQAYEYYYPVRENF